MKDVMSCHVHIPDNKSGLIVAKFNLKKKKKILFCTKKVTYFELKLNVNGPFLKSCTSQDLYNKQLGGRWEREDQQAFQKDENLCEFYNLQRL